MRIDTLWDTHKGGEIWIVGTGPSMRVFPLDILKDKTIIGLNQAWRLLPVAYSITVHPELFMDYMKDGLRTWQMDIRQVVSGSAEPYKTKWLVKKKPPMESLSFDHPEIYVFGTSNDLSVVRHRTKDTLYLGKGIHCTALALAAHMGAKNVFVVGCDACQLGGDHHGHAQHVRYHGLAPELVFAEYRKNAAKVRKIIRDMFGVNVVTVTPFVGAGHADEDYLRLLQEHGLSALPRPKDTSPYKRKKPSL